MTYILQTTAQLGLIYALVSAALFLSYRILNIADLSTDGTFVLGMCVSVAVSVCGHPFLGLFLAVLAGMCSGCITALLQTKLGIPSILAGIISNTALYTVNLAVMGFSSNLSLLKQETVFSLFQKAGVPYSNILFPFMIFGITAVFLNYFLKTRLGLSVRATGDNADMVKASSIDPRLMIGIGLSLANGITALSGGLIGQLQRSADINSGTGVVVSGLACLIIGESLIGKKTIRQDLLAVLCGSILYRLLYAIILRTRIFPIECLKLVTALLIAVAIASPYLKETANERRRHAENK